MDFNASAECRLFKAVMAQAVADAVLSDSKAYSRKPPKKRRNESVADYERRVFKTIEARRVRANRERAEARAWLLGEIPGMETVATFAGYNPDDIRERATKLRDAGWPDRVGDARAKAQKLAA
jgi:hypothetical protein